MKRFLLPFVAALCCSNIAQSQITITPGGGTAAITANLFGPGVTVSGMTITCGANGYGVFTGSLGTSGMTSGGIVLTSGLAATADGPNSSGSAGTNTGLGGNPILAAAQPMPGGYFDQCTIEFDIIPQCNTLSINYCFGSEEYPEFVSSSFNDGFGIFCSGPNPAGGTYTNTNMATLPGGIVVSIDNVNAGVNPTYYNTNTSGIMQYDGYTDGLIGTLAVVPCSTYHFVITVADAGDHIYDSGVFLQYQGLFCSTTALAFTATPTPTTCGGCNGSATATVTTGTAPFTYTWTNAAGAVVGTTATITGLCAGTYTVSVNDALSCTPPVPQTVTVAASTGPTVTPVAETCAGYNNGSVTINNAPGAGPYTVTINGPTTATVIEANTLAAVANFTGLPDGAYTFTVTGTGGCTFSGSFTITAGPPCCSVSTTGTNPLCAGGTTGTLTATPVGLPGYTYSWSTAPVQVTATATGVAAGTYTVTMTDASGCVATSTVTISNPATLNATTTPVHPLCNGGATGQITVNASGGTGALQYQINGGAFQASNVFTGLAAGTYTITVKDANGCTFTTTVTLNNPPVLNISLTTSAAATCGASNGSFTVAGSGGTPGYTYALGAGAFGASATFGGLAAGTYTATVKDVNGCTQSMTVTIGSSSGPTASVLSVGNVSCFGGVNGTALIGATGGTPTIMYTVDLAGATPPVGPQASNSFTNLPAGNYTATVTDANGCSGTTTFTITAPPALTYTTVKTNATCNGVCDGTITVSPTGGTPGYTFSSNNGVTFSAANPMTGLCAGTIFVVVKDANGCLANSTVVITQPTAITATYSVTHPICPGICDGTITFATASGGTPGYTYSIDPPGATPATPFQVSNLFTNLCDGPYGVTVKDANGCLLNATQTLIDPPGYTINVVDTTESHCGFNDGSLEVAASGGAIPYSYTNITAGIGPQPSGLFGGLVAGGYLIEVTDNDGCIESLFVGINDVEMDGILDGVTPATCFNSCDGTVQTHAINGAPPIQYELDLNGVFGLSGNYTGLCEGSHIVTIVDNGFCIFTIPFNITEPDSILFTITPTNITCNGGATGAISITGVTGGNGVYQYSIDNGGSYQASSTFTGLVAGTYDILVMDGNGCLGGGQVTLTQAPALSYAATITDLTCFANNSGTIVLAASGGTPGYTYSNNGGALFSAIPSFPSLAAGTYNIVVKDAAGCTVTGTETVNQPTALAAAYVSTQATCNGVCDGTITVNASGGTPSYQYSADNGITYQVSNVIAGLCDGTYNVLIKDANGCLVGSTQNIVEPTLVTFTTTVTPSSCGLANGAINFTAIAGGTPGYSTSITGIVGPFVAATLHTGLAAGTYPVAVEDANGCQVTGTATIVDQASPVITAIFTTDPLCFNDCNGIATITATGGTGALQYVVDGGAPQASNVFNTLCSGAHTIDVIDANGCMDSQGINLVNPAVLGFTSNVVNLTCFNDFTGSITINATGGTSPYTYSYDGGSTFTAASTLGSIAANTYNLEVTDDNGCNVTGTATVNQPAQLTFASVNVVDASCATVCDGTISTVVTGGTVAGVYTYSWAGGIAGPAQPNATNVCAGSYLIIVTDDNGCTINTTATVNEPPALVITSVTVNDALCAGSCDGSVVINCATATQFSAVPAGGAPVYGPTNTIGSLCTGSYDIAVTDAAGCPATTNVFVGEPSPLAMIVAPSSTICYNSPFSLFAIASGGTPNYTYDWDIASDVSSQTINPTSNQTHTVMATDANGCQIGPMTVTIDVIPQVTATVSANDTICEGASSTLTAVAANGLAPYQYYWQAPVNITSDVVTVTPTQQSTNYTVIAMDQCADSVVLTVNVSWYLPPVIDIVINGAAGCAPLTPVFFNNTSGFTSTACTWDFGNGNTSTNCATASSTYTTPGCYDVNLQLTSVQGCLFDSTFSQVVCVYGDPVPEFTWNPVPTILLPTTNFVNLSTNATSYVWNFMNIDSSIVMNPSYNFNDFEAGNYTVCLEATSSQGCVAEICHDVTVLDENLIYVPNVFTPDGDGTNDIFIPSLRGVDEDGYEFYIFNRWGELIFFTTDKQTGWDGTHKAAKSKEDVYVWKIRAPSSLNDDVHELNGHVTLVR
ncbi:MAG TPA: choice-of-anchor L domain-containing protein [Flavobacteriales bacterium]|nr:choice-of-anchor L domain-containing protein [Flavobacteriales bacterium]